MKYIASPALLGLSLFLSGCCTIEIPKKEQISDRKAAGKLAADLSQWQSKGELSGSYESRITQTFAELNQDAIVLILWLQAARCESEAGNKELAASIYQKAYDTYNQRNQRKLPESLDLRRVETGAKRITPGLLEELAKAYESIREEK